MPAAEMRVLGPVELVGTDGTVALAAKHVRLLSALVADGRPLDVDELVEAVWDESAPASARKLVQVYVSQLRKLLPSGVSVLTSDGAYAVKFSTPQVLDAARFESLLEESVHAREAGNPALALSLADRALALWRGRAFGELAYCEFARSESERLEELRLVAAEERLNALLGLGRGDAAVADALTFASQNPLRERAHELAMLALYQARRQADALAHYAALRERLDEELGIEPGQALRKLQHRILQQDPALDAASDALSSLSLPVAPNPLVGREREVDQLRALLDRRTSRLIVLTGAGGSGKTRLALEVARQAANTYANGVTLVELAPLRNPALVLPTIARAVGATEETGEGPLESLVTALSSKEMLLVVDNAEHVRAAASSFVPLVALAPRLTLLVTSRAVLHVSGEHVFPVAPLQEDDAIELFAQRARVLDPNFAINDDNQPYVREICRRVDGLPLAIELAVARIRTLTPRALLDRLDARLGVLTRGPRDLPARQQTLRGAIAWSIDLLSNRDRSVLERLAVFPGGATLEAAEIVCCADLDSLTTLVDDYLVLRVDSANEERFGMFETVREYALELLGSRRHDVELALAEYFSRIADELRHSAREERSERRIIERLVPEIDNVRVALAAATTADQSDLQVRLAGGLYRYWAYRGPVAEGLKWIELALAADTGPASHARAHALQGAAGLAWLSGDIARSKELAESATATAMAAGSTWDEGAAHTILGIVATAERDYETARYHHLRSFALSEELGVEPVVQKVNLGVVARECGDHEEAIALFEEVVAWHREHENLAKMAVALLNLGLAHHELGDHEASRREFEEARLCLERTGLRTSHAHALQGLAAEEAYESRFENAARLLGEARKELDDVGSPENGFAETMVSCAKATSLEALGEDAFAAAYAQGLTPG
jgi:predicted ATPase/DNA-binding SARP family transcriptional activator